jgi:membrane-associated phospholipid phosphatase
MRNARIVFRIGLFFLSLLLCSVRVTAQQLPAAKQSGVPAAQEKDLFDILFDDLEIAYEDGLAYFLAPLQYERSDWWRAAGVTGGTAGLLLLDRQIQRIPRSLQDPDVNTFVYNFHWGGNLTVAELLSGATYLTGWLAGEDDVRVTGRMFLQTLFYSGSVAIVLRTLTGRRWPAAKRGPYSFHFIEFEDTYQAFPSGHCVVAFSMATILSERIDNTLASVLLYAGAASVAFSRIYVDHHWASDIFLGSAIGYFTGKFVAARERSRDGKGKDAQAWTITPVPGGLGLSIRF